MTITGQALALAADDADDGPDEAVQDDPTAVAMSTAHSVGDALHHLARASQRMQAARAASTPELRAAHTGHLARHLKHALKAAHGLTENIRGHYPDEAAELEQVKQAVGLAVAVSDEAKSATTAHLLETTLHELAHARRHAQAMTEDTPDAEWSFNADHCEKHLGGAAEHAGKLAQHFTDNYPGVAKWLNGLGEIAPPAGEGDGKQDGEPQHAGYSKDGGETITAQMANPGTISGQLLDLGHWDGWRHEPRDAHGRWSRVPGASAARSLPWKQNGDVMHYKGSLGVDRKDMPQVTGTLADGRYAPSSEMMPKFLGHLKARGVAVTHERVPASSLKPTQTTGDARAVRGIAHSLASGELKDTKPVLVSSDNRVLDGHHQWAAHVLGESEGKRTGSAPGEPVIRADMPADKLMAEVRQFAKDHGIQNRKTGVAANPKYAQPSIAEQAAPADTLEKHTRPDGTLTPERAALHKQIIDGILAGHQPQAHPVAVFLGGGPASGKSTVMKGGTGDAAHIDSDAIKGQLPEYQEMTAKGDPKAAAFAHEESSAIAKEAVKEAQAKRVSYMLDGTGDSAYEKMAGKVNAAKKAGYQTEGRYVTIPTDEAVRRAAKRAQRTGRMVPASVIRETHKSVSDTYGKAAKNNLFDKTELWDNSGDAPKLVAHKDAGGQFTVKDPAAWQAFLDKAAE